MVQMLLLMMMLKGLHAATSAAAVAGVAVGLSPAECRAVASLQLLLLPLIRLRARHACANAGAQEG
jgi:hypothetical protein